MDPVPETPPLEELLLELLAMPCVTGDEGPIADWLERRYAAAGERVQRVGNSVVVGRPDPGRPTVLLVGHTDVVPPTEDDVVPRRDGDRIVGRGASDMKAGLAVALSCFEDVRLREGAYNLLVVAYAGEEGPHEGNELALLLADLEELAYAELAIVLEPTDLTVQLGCLGALHAELLFEGRAAHSARPWHGENALTKAGRFLAALDGRGPEDVELDGLVYREVMTATQAWTGGGAPGGGRNVVPDRFTVNVNYRFAPTRDTGGAAAVMTALGEEWGATTSVVDAAPACPPRREAPLVEAFIGSVGLPVEPKQAWTDVARLDAVGVPALNFGPGMTAQAHQRGEYVPVEHLGRARAALARFLAGPGAPGTAPGSEEAPR